MPTSKANDWPLQNGDTVCIVGGGPGGASCALAIKREAEKLGKEIRVLVFEQKRFNEGRQFNQCIGVLSPPLEDILRDQLGLELPESMLRKKIEGYHLHSDRMDLALDGKEHGSTYAVSRSEFDEFLFDQAVSAGVEINHNRITGMEVGPHDVLVYSEGQNCRAAVVVGAFGLDEGTAWIFERATRYRRPDFLNTIITRLYPGPDFLNSLGPWIHAFLVSRKGMEFGAVTPKHDHLSINIAGRAVASPIMVEFLRSPPVQKLLPPKIHKEKPLNFFKGKFPISPAGNLFGDRYVTIGDAAGLIRPFKGKGINSACLTGIYAARCMMNFGVSRKAFQNYIRDCEELTADLWYGRAIRLLTNLSTRYGFMDHILNIAARDPLFMEAMFNIVSGELPYKQIFKSTFSPRVGLNFSQEIFKYIFRQPLARRL